MHSIIICILAIVAIGIDFFPVYANEPNRIFINILIQKPPQKDLSTTHRLNEDSSDILIAQLSKQLLNAGYQVLTLDEITASKRISESDIRQADHGNLGKLRKIGAINGAGYILNGTLSTSISDQEVMGAKMARAVTILSYKIIETANSKVIEVESRKSIGAGGSPSSAIHVAATKLSDKLLNTMNQRIPLQTSAGKVEQLVKLQNQYKKETTNTPVTSAPKVPVAKSPPETVKKITKNGYPQIIIINPPMPRGFKVVEKRKAFNLEGQAIDKTGIETLIINDASVNVDKSGFFQYPIELQPGDNKVEIIATNKIGNSATKRIQIAYPIDKSPPLLTLIHPKIARGFAVIDKKPSKTTRVEGLVKDEGGILFLRINDKKIDVLENGHFSYLVPMKKNMEKIVIEAADTVGNLTRKELKIDRQFDGSRKASALSDKTYSGTSALKPVLWGLGIGVSRYKSAIVDLKYADDDILALERFFKTQEGKLFSEVHFKTLINEAVSRESVISNISTHLGQAAPDDVVFIFLAGHGIKHHQSGSYYFLPYDVDNSNLLSRGVRMSDFEEAVTILSQNVGKVILAMDTCHSGALSVGARSGSGGEDLVATLREASGIYILAAAKGGEESLEDERFKIAADDVGHGVFTYALLKGMSGGANFDGDGYISLHEIFQYVSKQVPRLTSGRQHPYYRSEGTDMPLIVIDR